MSNVVEFPAIRQRRDVQRIVVTLFAGDGVVDFFIDGVADEYRSRRAVGKALCAVSESLLLDDQA